MKTISSAACAALCLIQVSAFARGVSPYLPLNLEPETERQIERVLILANKPVLMRPIAAATVLDALPVACDIDPALCAQVRRYLHRYMSDAGLTHASVEGAASSGASHRVPNRYGLESTSPWALSASAFWQPNDYLLATLGGIAHEGESSLSGSILSVGFSKAQLDLGFRPHELSPMTDSSMLLSTEAVTMPSVTLSNYMPLTRLGLQYEFFLARMSKAPILFENQVTSGYPRLAGFHLGAEPVSGWAISINRLMQFGGGLRDNSLHDLLNAFFRPGPSDTVNPSLNVDEEFGNQLGAITTRFLYPGRTPFAVYFEYGGEDTSRGGSYTFGNASLAAGIHFPRLWQRFDLTYEVSEWQNSWYVHHIYRDGLVNKGNVIGHWGGDQRAFADGVGAQSHMLRMGWEPSFGGLLEMQYRTLANESYSAVSYQREHDITARYSRPWGPLTVGGEVIAGRDVFGENFSRVAAFFRYAGDYGDEGSFVDAESALVGVEGAEIFADAGFDAYRIRLLADQNTAAVDSSTRAAPHFAVGARRAVSAHNDLGARVELDQLDGHLLICLRALDYRYRFAGPLAASLFIGAANYRIATPAIGGYFGAGLQWRDVLPGWDAGLDFRYVSNAARDRLLPSDPPGVRPDIFRKIPAATLYLSRRF